MLMSEQSFSRRTSQIPPLGGVLVLKGGGVPAFWGWREAGAAQMSLHEPRFVPSHPRREQPPRCRARHGAGHSGVQHLSPLLCSLLFPYSTTQIWERALAPLHQSLATTNLAPSGVLWGGTARANGEHRALRPPAPTALTGGSSPSLCQGSPNPPNLPIFLLPISKSHFKLLP